MAVAWQINICRFLFFDCNADPVFCCTNIIIMEFCYFTLAESCYFHYTNRIMVGYANKIPLWYIMKISPVMLHINGISYWPDKLRSHGPVLFMSMSTELDPTRL